MMEQNRQSRNTALLTGEFNVFQQEKAGFCSVVLGFLGFHLDESQLRSFSYVYNNTNLVKIGI
jgi:hypothetical protein